MMFPVDQPVPPEPVCTCFWTDPSMWTTHYSAVEPGSQREWNPECDEHPCGCGEDLKRRMREMGVEANASRWYPGMVMPAGFDEFGMSCPHGVRWHLEPTTDQRLRWNETRTP